MKVLVQIKYPDDGDTGVYTLGVLERPPGPTLDFQMLYDQWNHLRMQAAPDGLEDPWSEDRFLDWVCEAFNWQRVEIDFACVLVEG